MRKRIIAVSLSVLFLFSGCSDKDNSTPDKVSSGLPSVFHYDPPADNSTHDRIANSLQNFVLAFAPEVSVTFEDTYVFPEHNEDLNYAILDIVGDCYYGIGELTLIDMKSCKEREIIFPQELPEVRFNSSFIVINNRYVYQWSEAYGDDIMNDVSDNREYYLTCLDTETGIMTIKDPSPFMAINIKLFKIDDDSFISSFFIDATTDDNNKTHIHKSEITNLNGQKIEFINYTISFLYSNNVYYTNNFYIDQDKIYAWRANAFVREGYYFIDQYDFNGNLLKTTDITDLGKHLISKINLESFKIVGDYIIVQGITGNNFRMLLSTIFKINDGNLQKIAQESYSYLSYVIVKSSKYDSSYLLYSLGDEKNEQRPIIDKPLYCIDTSTGKTKSILIPDEFKRYNDADMRSLSNGDVLFCFEDASYYVLSADKLAKLMNQ